MTESEAHELLIRIDAQMRTMLDRVERMEKQWDDKMYLLNTIPSAVDLSICATHAEKIRTIERIVWGTLGLSLTSFFHSIWIMLGGK